MSFWIVHQDMEASSDVPWVRFNGSPGPYSFTLPPTRGEAPLVSLDATGLSQGIHSGTITWRSLDSGSPAFERATAVLMDVGRQILGGSYSPPLVVTVDNAMPIAEVALTSVRDTAVHDGRGLNQ